uniref:Uncharacterized protein n=1 Tax=Arundo donax TaxID=35708 RepID=A0A0A8ZRR6_ARUDO
MVCLYFSLLSSFLFPIFRVLAVHCCRAPMLEINSNQNDR